MKQLLQNAVYFELITWAKNVDRQFKERREREKTEKVNRKAFHLWMKNQPITYLNALRSAGEIFEDKLFHFVGTGRICEDLSLRDIFFSPLIKIYFGIRRESLDREILELARR